MRAVHISKVAGIAGSERHLLTLLPGLRLHGVDARMIVLEDDSKAATPFCDRLVAAGVGVDRLRIRHDIDFGAASRLVTLLSSLDPDIVHTHLLHADLYGLRAAHLLGITATVSSRHNTDRFRHNPLIRWANHRAMRHAARIIAISPAVSDFVVSVERCDPAHVVTIPYGFDATRHSAWSRERARAHFNLGATEPVVAVVARLTKQKGVDVLIDAFARVRMKKPAARLLIVGDGPDRVALVARARNQGLANSTIFAGWVDEAWTVMGAADIVAVPSRWEGFCLSAVEAMAAGRPVVASDVDALSELIVSGETGLLVAPDDPAALAAAIASVLDNPALAAHLGEQARAHVRHAFPMNSMIASTLAVYADIADARPSAHAVPGTTGL